MKRDRLRNHGPRVLDELTLRGFEALVLENSLLRVTVLPEKGSDIVELRYKPLDLDVLWRAPAGFWTLERLYPADFTSRASFIDYYPGGWQEIVPNGGPGAVYRGAPFDEHGEVALLPWRWSVVMDEPAGVAVKLVARTLRVPLLVEKTLTLRDSAVLAIKETVTNTGAEAVEYMWGHHPALGAPFLDQSCVIDVPPCSGHAHPVERFPTQRLPPDRAFDWPLVESTAGEAVDLSRVQPPGSGTADLVYLTELSEAWWAVTNQRLGLSFGMAWTRETFPHLWYWHDANGTAGYPWYSGAYVLALEPWSSFPSMGLAEAVARGTNLVLQPGEQRSAELVAAFATGLRRVGHIDLDGAVSGR